MVRQRSRRKPHPSSSGPVRKPTAEETFRNIADGKSPTTGSTTNPRAGRRRQRSKPLPLHRESPSLPVAPARTEN